MEELYPQLLASLLSFLLLFLQSLFLLLSAMSTRFLLPLALLILLVLVVSAQSSDASRRGGKKPQPDQAQDPIGAYRLQVTGTFTKDGQQIATMRGLGVRLPLPEEQSVALRWIAEIDPAGEEKQPPTSPAPAKDKKKPQTKHVLSGYMFETEARFSLLLSTWSCFSPSPSPSSPSSSPSILTGSERVRQLHHGARHPDW